MTEPNYLQLAEEDLAHTVRWGGISHLRAEKAQALLEELARLRKECKLLLGAMAAQDEREAQAGARCGVLRESHGCDWPDAVADELSRLRNVEEALKVTRGF